MKIACITSRFPFPVEKGDKLRAFHQLKGLAEKHEVHLFAISHEDVSETDREVLREFCASVRVYRIRKLKLILNLLSGWINGFPAQVAYFLDQTLRRQMQVDLIGLNPDHIFVQLIRAAEYARVLPLPKTLDYMDVFSVGALQRSRTGNVLLRPFFAIEAKRLTKYERSVYGDFTRHLIISVQDRDRLPLAYQGNVAVIPNGVDMDYFTRITSTDRDADVVFVGNMGYLPNIEAAEYLAKEVMPRIWRFDPEATLTLVGARPHRRVRALASERVHVTGWVEDIRPWYSRARVFAAPMHSGLGQQNKILEAMAMECACVTTSIVDKAIGGAMANALVVAEDADNFAAAITELLSDREQASRMAARARAFVTSQYRWDAQNKALEDLLFRSGKSQEAETMNL